MMPHAVVPLLFSSLLFSSLSEPALRQSSSPPIAIETKVRRPVHCEASPDPARGTKIARSFPATTRLAKPFALCARAATGRAGFQAGAAVHARPRRWLASGFAVMCVMARQAISNRAASARIGGSATDPSTPFSLAFRLSSDKVRTGTLALVLAATATSNAEVSVGVSAWMGGKEQRIQLDAKTRFRKLVLKGFPVTPQGAEIEVFGVCRAAVQTKGCVRALVRAFVRFETARG